CGEPALPGGPQKDFQKRFRTQSRARRYYTAAGGWFIVIPKHLAKALEIVKEKQNASFGERQAFIANPSAILKERLEDEYSEDEIESFFEETPEFLSARVSHLGVWEPKQNVYIMGSGQKWLPDDNEAFGVMLGDSLYSINPGDIPDVYDELELAKKQGEKSVGYHEQNIPVTEESLETFGRLSQSIRRSASGKDELNESDKPGQKAQMVPILIDNIEESGYVAPPRQVRGEPGGLPAVLKTTTLFPHQADGVKWLQEHCASGSTGALLADDMGLGKTLQTLTFLAWVQEQMDVGNHQRKPLLIVAPTGLLKNWEDEGETHLASPGLGAVFKAFGAGLKGLDGLTHNQRRERFISTEWVLTTYETLRDKIRYFLPVD
ncbi:MAG: hypothetical protein K8F24_10780, partial [Bacteroidales bacterium]|nr:hypothetical protein [Bacteroidales bacterium]